MSPSRSGRRFAPSAVLTQQKSPSAVSTTAATGIVSTSSYRSKTTSTSALIPGFNPSTEGSSMMVSYFTTFPVHQPAGLVTVATEATAPSSSESGSVILAVSVLVTVALVVWSVKSLPASDRGIQLCTDGPFRHVRHPLYAAFQSVFNFGLAIYLNSYVFVAWAALLHPLWHRVIRYEERLMIEIFGDEHADYRKTTGRFVPRSRLWHRGSVSR